MERTEANIGVDGRTGPRVRGGIRTGARRRRRIGHVWFATIGRTTPPPPREAETSIPPFTPSHPLPPSFFNIFNLPVRSPPRRELHAHARTRSDRVWSAGGGVVRAPTPRFSLLFPLLSRTRQRCNIIHEKKYLFPFTPFSWTLPHRSRHHTARKLHRSQTRPPTYTLRLSLTLYACQLYRYIYNKTHNVPQRYTALLSIAFFASELIKTSVTPVSQCIYIRIHERAVGGNDGEKRAQNKNVLWPTNYTQPV